MTIRKHQSVESLLNLYLDFVPNWARYFACNKPNTTGFGLYVIAFCELNSDLSRARMLLVAQSQPFSSLPEACEAAFGEERTSEAVTWKAQRAIAPSSAR